MKALLATAFLLSACGNSVPLHSTSSLNNDNVVVSVADKPDKGVSVPDGTDTGKPDKGNDGNNGHGNDPDKYDESNPSGRDKGKKK